jgi:hypothetical protein
METTMSKHLKLLTASLIMVLTLASPQVLHGMESDTPKQDPEFIELGNLHQTVVVLAAIEACKSNISPIKFLQLSKDWQAFFKNSTMEGKPLMQTLQDTWFGVPGNEETYQTLLNCVYRYRMRCIGNDWKNIIKIGDLPIPLYSEVKLPNNKLFESVNKYYGIRVGIPQAFKADDGKDVVWLCPRFAVAKLIETTNNTELKEILNAWDEKFSFGVFFTKTKGSNLYIVHFLGNQDQIFISDNDFSHILERAVQHGRLRPCVGHAFYSQFCNVHFVN